MAGKPVVFDERTGRDLAMMLRQWRVHGRRFDRAEPERGISNTNARQTAFLKVTSSTPDADGYPCKLRERGASSWSEPYSEMRVIGADGETFAVDDVVQGILSRVTDTGVLIWGAVKSSGEASCDYPVTVVTNVCPTFGTLTVVEGVLYFDDVAVDEEGIQVIAAFTVQSREIQTCDEAGEETCEINPATCCVVCETCPDLPGILYLNMPHDDPIPLTWNASAQQWEAFDVVVTSLIGEELVPTELQHIYFSCSVFSGFSIIFGTPCADARDADSYTCDPLEVSFEDIIVCGGFAMDFTVTE